MNKPKHSDAKMPRIERFKFGLITIDGEKFDQDVILLPDGSVTKRRDSGDRKLHANELGEIISANPRCLIVGQGTMKSMKLTGKALRKLREAGIKVEAYKTGKACARYQQSCDQGRVAAVLHLRA